MGGAAPLQSGAAQAAFCAVDFDAALAFARAALGQPVRAGEKLASALTGPLGSLVPKAWRPIDAPTVARAIRRAVAEGRPGTRVLGSGEMQALGRPEN